MLLNQAALLNLGRHYEASGLATLRKKPRMKNVAPEIRNSVDRTLDAIDRLTKLDLSCKDGCGPEYNPNTANAIDENIDASFRNYRYAIDRIRNSEDLNPTTMELFTKTGRLLYEGVEPLLDTRCKQALELECIKPLHRALSFAHFDYPSFKTFGLVSKAGYQEFDEELGVELGGEIENYCRETLLPQIFDAGCDMPYSMSASIGRDQANIHFDYGAKSKPKAPGFALISKLEKQLFDRIRVITSNVFKDEQPAQIIARFNFSTLDHNSACQERARRLEQARKTYKLDRLEERLELDRSKFDLSQNLASQAFVSCFAYLDNALVDLITDLGASDKSPQEFHECDLRIARAIDVLERLLDKHKPQVQETESGFAKAIKRYRRIVRSFNEFERRHIPEYSCQTDGLSVDTFDRLYAFYDHERLVLLNDEDDEADLKSKTQLESLFKDANSRKIFAKIFKAAVDNLVNLLFIAIDPLDLRQVHNLGCSLLIKQGKLDHRNVALSVKCNIRNPDDGEFKEYFAQKYSDLIKDITENVSSILIHDLNKVLKPNWTIFNPGEEIPLNVGVDFSNFRLRSPSDFRSQYENN